MFGYFFFFFASANALAAISFSFFVDFGLASTLPASLATFLPVVIMYSFVVTVPSWIPTSTVSLRTDKTGTCDPLSMDQDDLPRSARISIAVPSPEGELAEIVLLFTNIVRRDTATFREELQNLVNSLAETSETKPVITEQETPYPGGGGAAAYGIAFAVGLPPALAYSGIYDLLKKLSHRFSWTSGSPPREQFLMENANPMALGVIQQMFGITRDDLRPVITDVRGQHAKLVYQARDGSTITVNMENTDKFTITGVQRNWPNGQWGAES